jgi:hypothetical protein
VLTIVRYCRTVIALLLQSCQCCTPLQRTPCLLLRLPCLLCTAADQLVLAALQHNETLASAPLAALALCISVSLLLMRQAAVYVCQPVYVTDYRTLSAPWSTCYAWLPGTRGA